MAHHQLVAFSLLLFVIGVVPLVFVDALEGDFKGFGGELVEEKTVVRDDDIAVLVVDEIIFEPAERVDIKVVGRLIKQEQCRVLQQQFGEVQTHLPSAGKGLYFFMKIYFAESEAAEHLFGIGLHGVTAQMVKFVHGIGKTFDKVVIGFAFIILFGQGELVLHPGYFIGQLEQSCVCLEGILQGGFFQIGIKGDLLGKIADGGISRFHEMASGDEG